MHPASPSSFAPFILRPLHLANHTVSLTTLTGLYSMSTTLPILKTEAQPAGFNNKSASPTSIVKHLDVQAEEPKILASDLDDGSSSGVDVEAQHTISTVRTVLLTTVMLLTWFLNTASAASVTLLLPVMVADLQSDFLQIQWVSTLVPLVRGKRCRIQDVESYTADAQVVSAYTLAFGW